MYILWDLAFVFYSLVYVPYLILTKRWHSSYLQRFGVFPEEVRGAAAQGLNVWVHAVSVGEVQAVEGLVRAIRAERPGTGIVCTVTTRTGLELARTRLAGVATVLASPLDFSFTARAFIRLIQPRLYVAAETEIWPNLFYFLQKTKVPIAVVNGRISDRSYGRYKLIAPALKGTLGAVGLFAMQTDEDARRIISLGADPACVITAGNIKFDDVPAAGDANGAADGAPLFLAGSTHPGEEEILLNAFKRLKKVFPSWRLALAPRHVERAREVVSLVAAAGFKPVLFSEAGGLDADGNAVTIVDVIGRLRALYAGASLVFVGKSLCVGGGHNIIEPAAAAKPVIIGPMMANFRDVTACFKAEDALVQVAGPEELEQAARELMGDAGRRADLGRRARAVVDKNRGATRRTVHELSQWL